MLNGSRLNGKGRLWLGVLAFLVVFIGLVVAYGREHGSESAVLKAVVNDVAELKEHDKQVDAMLAKMAETVAITATNVEWLRAKGEREQ